MPINPHNPFKGRQHPGEVIVLCVRWYLRYPLSYEHVAELLAGFRCEVLGGGDPGQYKSVTCESGLGGQSEQLADEVSLADRISFGQPPHSALPDHVHCLDSLQRSPRTLKRSIPLGQPNSFLNRPVVLFNHVIEILALA